MIEFSFMNHLELVG